MIVERGTRGKLGKYFNLNDALIVTLKISGTATYDFCCFGVDANDKLSDDRYMIFYNQLSSPNGEIVGTEISNGMNFSVKLNDLPQTIQKLVFTASIDGNGTMGEISRHEILIGNELSANFGGGDFQQEKAITSLEIYRKNGEWRFNVVARGFNGGLDALLAFYGGEQADEISTTEPEKISPPNNPPAPKKISLEKKISEGAPKLISLVKPLKVELEKRNLLDVVARVALVLDISGSMSGSYYDGTVQEIVNKILPVAVQFDDDGELDFWYYGSRCERRPSVNMKNYEKAVPRTWEDLMSKLGYGNNEPVVMREVVDEYETSDLPAYVVFVTDGGISKTAQIKQLLIDASYLPIFWQFVGVSGSGYGILKDLDSMSGRYVDNANFFALDDFRSVPNNELYSRLLNEFPAWLKACKSNGVFDGSAKNNRSTPPSEKSFGDKIKGIFGF
ncbi:MAG: VWA domain-containing protein [Selenomonadaceae bacterium]|nr:VWA domain-containing protein [Selenomonadaceae bacterium]